MKHYVYIFNAILFLAACQHGKHANEQVEKENKDSVLLADLKFERKKVDFGIVSKDTVLNARYDFINTSNDTLVIRSVTPDCTCTGYTLSKKQIPPKDSAYITLQMSTKNRSGEVEVYSTVSANTPTKLYSLKLAANVK